MRGEALEFGGEFREIQKENTFVCCILLDWYYVEHPHLILKKIVLPFN